MRSKIHSEYIPKLLDKHTRLSWHPTGNDVNLTIAFRRTRTIPHDVNHLHSDVEKTAMCG